MTFVDGGSINDIAQIGNSSSSATTVVNTLLSQLSQSISQLTSSQNRVWLTTMIDRVQGATYTATEQSAILNYDVGIRALHQSFPSTYFSDVSTDVTNPATLFSPGDDTHFNVAGSITVATDMENDMLNNSTTAILFVATSTSFNFIATQGSTATSSQSITVNNAGGASSTLNWSATSTQPWLTFNPASGSIVGEGSANVSFIVNPTSLVAGTYNATATIADPNASSSPQTIPVTLTISGTGVSATMAAPANLATVSSTVPVTATATSTAGIASVQFYLDGSPLGSAATSSPYTISWNTASSTNGNHSLYALATDNYANTATSTSVTVTVANPPVISAISTGTPLTTAATIAWITDQAADSLVEYGTSSAYTTSSTYNASYVTSHSVTLTGLNSLTPYHFRVDSSDGVLATSSDSTFTTAAMASGGSGGNSVSAGGGAVVSVGGGYGQPYIPGVGIIASATNPAPPASSSSSLSLSSSSLLLELQSLKAKLAVLQAEANATAFQATTTSTTVTTSPASPFLFPRNLSYGMAGSDVKTLQQFLNEKGFSVSQTGFGSPGDETVNFGGKTLQAVVKFQKSAGIPATGYFGPITRAYVNGFGK